MFVCSECKGEDVIVRGWFSPNENHAPVPSIDWELSYCGDCKEECYLEKVEEE
jgi:hypothetical protein